MVTLPASLDARSGTPVLALCALAVAVLIWPDRRPRTVPSLLNRLAGRRFRLPGTGACALAFGSLTVLAAGPLPGVAAGMFAATAVHLARDHLRERGRACEWNELLAALRMLARDLRSGAPPVAAAASAAAASSGPASELLIDLVAAARLGVDRMLPTRPGPTGSVSAQLRSGMKLSSRHGVPWATLVEAVATDAADRVQAAGLRAAQVAGPRFSGYVLAALPLFGLALGSGMGADPLRVLLGPAPGGLLLPVGTALCCAGLLWSARIVRP